MNRLKFGPREEMAPPMSVSMPSILDFMAVAIVLVTTGVYLREDPGPGRSSLWPYAVLGGVALLWGVVKVTWTLFKEVRIPATEFFMGICLGTLFVGAFILETKSLSGFWEGLLFGVTILAGIGFLFRHLCRRFMHTDPT